MSSSDTIVALATPAGSGAIAVIRLSGAMAIPFVEKHFKSPSGKKRLSQQHTHTIHLGYMVDATETIDEVLVSIFRNPNSYTGEDVIEISCHGSLYIQQQILQMLLRSGCRMALAGEFTLRAFLNGKMDLSQAEAVADLIASSNKASHRIAMQQMRGGFSSQIKALAEDLLNFTSLIALELDFSEEDVVFADRTQLEALVGHIASVLKALTASFAVGNVIKNGIAVAIVGEPNAGKSTLLNALLNDDKAIVSEIAGTTRDAVEDNISIGGIGFRFIDTAGIRETEDAVEAIGIKKTFEKIDQAQVVIYLLDASTFKTERERVKDVLKGIAKKYPKKPIIVLANKIDIIDETLFKFIEVEIPDVVSVSAKSGQGLDALIQMLLSLVYGEEAHSNETVVSNARHYDALNKALKSIQSVRKGLAEGLSGDLLSVDIRQALHHLGEITGQVTHDDVLKHIFSNFCIGK